jgi:uncharacterized protein YcbX
MQGRITALYRYPIKGFTPEPVATARLEVGGCFPADRLYAVEDGPSGFDMDAPAYVPKMKYAVLAKLEQVAKARTAYDETTGVLRAGAVGHPDIEANLLDEDGRAHFAAWLTGVLGEAASGPLKVLLAPGYRFLDHPRGHLSVINLASIRDLSAKVGYELDPLRFRANLYVEGWPAWAEMDWTDRTLTLGEATTTVFKPIIRCAAIDVDPATAERGDDLVKALWEHQGHAFCGLYLHVTGAGSMATGDVATLVAQPETAA